MIYICCVVVFLLGVFCGCQAEKQINELRNLTHDEYMRGVQHLLNDFGSDKEKCKVMVEELTVYADDIERNFGALSNEIQHVVNKVKG